MRACVCACPPSCLQVWVFNRTPGLYRLKIFPPAYKLLPCFSHTSPNVSPLPPCFPAAFTLCRCGFATTQQAYESAVSSLFSCLDSIDAHLASHRFLCSSDAARSGAGSDADADVDALTLSDVRLFTTLLRFDAVYHPLFKCSQGTIQQYTNIYNYMKDIYQVSCVLHLCHKAVLSCEQSLTLIAGMCVAVFMYSNRLCCRILGIPVHGAPLITLSEAQSHC